MSTVIRFILVCSLFCFITTSYTCAKEEKSKPLKALFILGGEYHCYEQNSRILAKSLSEKMSIEFDFVRIDRPPKGKPRAEKATLPPRQEVLEDKGLRKKYDLILAYNQEDFTNLTHKQRDGYLHYVRSGGSWVGIHSAGDFLKACPDYVRMVGGKFKTHPPYQKLHIQRMDGNHYILEGIEDFDTMDEFYHMTDCSLEGKNILLAGVSPMDGKTRPVAWTRRYGKGKVFYTILGHSAESFQNKGFDRLLYRAVLWAVAPEVGVKGEDGWINLFNGVDLAGWTHCGPGRFVVENGALKSEGGMGLLWFDRRSFRDFTLSLEYKTARKQDNSGIYVRFPEMPADEWEPVHAGYEIQIGASVPGLHSTGSVYGFEGPKKIPAKPVGEWNLMEITVKGQQYRVSLNNEEITVYDKGDRGREGYVGLQNHDVNSILRFRNIKVKEL